MVGREKRGEEPRERTFPREHVSMATIPLISVPALQVDLESPAAAVLDTHACLEGMLPERPNPRCHRALLTAQLSRQRLWGQWSGCLHEMHGGLQRGSRGSWCINQNREGACYLCAPYMQITWLWKGRKEKGCCYLEMCHVCIWCIYLNYWTDGNQIAW